MAKLTVKRGATSRIEHVFIQDSSSTTGAGKTALTHSSVTAYYFRPKDTTPTVISLTGTGSLGTYASGFFKEINATDMPGLYEIGIPDGVFARTDKVDHAVVMIKGAGIAPVVLEYDLAIGEAVWDEPYNNAVASHTIAGTFGKLMDILRKSNLSTEGSVTNTTRTTAKFTTSLTRSPTPYTENYFAGQTLLFVSGDLTGQSSVIESFTVSGGVIVLDSKLSDTPANGDEFVILPVHVHPSVEIGQAMLDKRLGEAGRIPYVSASLTNTSPTINGFNAYQDGDRVTPQTTGGGFTAGNTYYVLSTVTPTTFQLANNSGGTAIDATATTTLTFMPIEERTVRSAMQYLRNKIELASGELKVYSENDTVLAWKAATTTDSNANPITVFDPTN